MAECAKCGAPLDGIEDQPVASMSGSVMGDECTKAYYWCAACGVYTVATYYEPFCGEETVSVEGPFPKAEGDVKVALIRRCDEPWDKKCRCAAHKAFFEGMLD